MVTGAITTGSLVAAPFVISRLDIPQAEKDKLMASYWHTLQNAVPYLILNGGLYGIAKNLHLKAGLPKPPAPKLTIPTKPSQVISPKRIDIEGFLAESVNWEERTIVNFNIRLISGENEFKPIENTSLFISGFSNFIRTHSTKGDNHELNQPVCKLINHMLNNKQILNIVKENLPDLLGFALERKNYRIASTLISGLEKIDAAELAPIRQNLQPRLSNLLANQLRANDFEGVQHFISIFTGTVGELSLLPNDSIRISIQQAALTKGNLVEYIHHLFKHRILTEGAFSGNSMIARRLQNAARNQLMMLDRYHDSPAVNEFRNFLLVCLEEPQNISH